ncbi:hypothetical protein B0T19DRAFT_450769 [Cercophora scortea]|uniref:Uncharacterized protein n=1 Tax=Cercophora scortea TaxID=314031 RepID=A0AAE0I914_9PEZI|nr:hypothetical protein B0T19DRAFT_450769 [Cercophora scortea]
MASDPSVDAGKQLLSIWQIADKENRGFLTPAGFGIVLRLIGHAQAGREPTAELALQQGPIPRFDGFTPTPAPPPPPPAASPAALPSQGTGGQGPIRIPPLTPEKVAQYAGLFERQPLQNGGLLPGEQAKQIFEKAALPNEILGRIWMLADTEQRGALVQTEFVIAMHLLTSMKTGALRALPTILPAALYEAATRRAPGGGVANRQQSPTIPAPPISAASRQLTGQASLTQMRTGSPLGRPPLAAHPTGEWLVTPADKGRFDLLYDELDTTRKGYITGEEAVPFFSQSNLPEDALAQIWDLADINSAGRLTKDEFAVAMYLIRQQRSKREGPAALLPTTLPPGLIPPSMRGQARAPLNASAFESPPRPQPQPRPSALDDLFGLDDPVPPPPAQAQVAVGTGGSAAHDPFASMSPAAPSSPARPSPLASNFKPFVPSSSFGRGLTAQVTGGSNTSGSNYGRPSPLPTTAEADLLGDNEPEVSKSLSSETTELANLSNQIGSLSKQMQDVQGQRATTQNELNQALAQKKNFEQPQDVRSLETQLNTSRNETKKLQAETAMVEASYQDLQNQHRQIVTALQADQQENASLKEKIRTVNGEIAQLKPQIEKLKSEARQQKGLVAINKKQLATNEGEREKLKTEVEELTKSNEELARQVSSSPVLTQVASPALSTASANNPFFRRTASTDITASFSSPPAMRSFSDKSFDDAGTPPPVAATLFKPQNTGTSTTSATLPDPYQPFADAHETLPRQASPALSRVSQAETPHEPQPHSVASPVEAAPTGQSLASGSSSEASKGASASTSTESKPVSNGTHASPATGSDADPFAVVDQAKAKEDFESAFASFKSAQTRAPTISGLETTKAFSSFHSEFPPISELERDDEDSEDTDTDGAGFDDDFAPSSPPVKTTEKAADPRSPSPAVTNSSAVPDQAAASERPTSPSTTTTRVDSFSGSHVDDIFGSATSLPPAAATPVASPPAAAPAAIAAPKGAFDDLDDDFDGLEDAKEGSADDDFANISRSGLDDFNPVFDSSPPPSQAKSESAFTNTQFGGGESQFDFGSLSSASVAGSTTAAQSGPTKAAPASDPHDWDAIFAGLEDTPSASSPPMSSGNANAKEAASSRPAAPGRALTEEGEHDDPILKNLTGMGYSRTDSLAALEKYDYNLERAANFLASHS